MSSKDEETEKPDETGESVSRPKRPAQTIDLQAEEVEVEIRKVGDGAESGSDDDDESAEESPAGADDADAHDHATKPDTGPKISRGSTPGTRPPPPPQRTRPSDVRGFVTHLAAGLVGGLIGVVGAGVGLDKLSIPGLGGAQAPSQDLSRIEQRLDELSAEFQSSGSTQGTLSAEKLDGLENRLAAIETKPPPDPPAIPDALKQRVDMLEDTLKRLQAAGAQAGSGTLEQSAALDARIDVLEKATREKLESLDRDLIAAREAIEKTASIPGGTTDTAALDDMAQRIAGLEKSLAEAAARPAAAEASPGGESGAVVLAYESLRRAAMTGEPFKAQLEMLEELAGTQEVLKPFAAAAAKGVRTRSALLAQWPGTMRQARLAGARAEDKTFLDRLATNASTVVRIRRVGPAADGGSIARDSLSGAVKQAESLTGAAAEAAASWLEEARTRAALDKALKALEAALLSGMSGVSPKKE